MAEARIVKRSEGDVLEGMSWLFKATGAQTGGRFDFMVGPVEYLSGPPLHVHRDQDDSFFVLEGILTVQVGHEVVDLEPGDFASAPPGVPHTFDNVQADRSPVLTVNLMTPGGLHDFFVERARLGPDQTDASVLEQLTERYGLSTVGPPLRVKLGLA
jgi:mannose-6-phosphate isomerase-like protein (cupin superfamily)